MKALIALALLSSGAAASSSAIAQSESWTYVKPGGDLSSYTAVLVRPTVVSKSAAAQFDGIPLEQRRQFAGLVTNALQTELATSFDVAGKRSPHTLAIQVTILGAKKTTGGVATATRVLPIGLATNVLKSLAGKKGTLTGSLLVEVEFTNAASGELLAAAIRRRTPDPLDVPATLSTTDTVKAIARDMARTIRQKLADNGMPVRQQR
jgi:hypothetical protein